MPEQYTAAINLRLTPTMRERLNTLAATEQRSVLHIIRRAIEAELTHVQLYEALTPAKGAPRLTALQTGCDHDFGTPALQNCTLCGLDRQRAQDRQLGEAIAATYTAAPTTAAPAVRTRTPTGPTAAPTTAAPAVRTRTPTGPTAAAKLAEWEAGK